MRPYFESPESEYQVLRSAAGLLDLSERELLRIVGEDRVSFLHGMVTQDVKGLPAGQTTYAAMVNAKGAMVGDARIWKREPELWVEVEPQIAAKAKEFLEKYLISEDAEVTDVSAEWAPLGLWGPKAREVFAKAAGKDAPGAEKIVSATIGGVGVQACGDANPAAGGVTVMVPRAQLEAVSDALVAAGAVRVGEQAAEMVRVEAGVPRYGRDMDDATIPLEAELQRAISYNKGCYIGQEVIARATFRGQMSRKLSGLVLTGEPVAPKTDLRVGGKKIGWVTTAVRVPGRPETIALGYVHRNHLEPGTVLDVQLADQEPIAKATVVKLPFGARALSPRACVQNGGGTSSTATFGFSWPRNSRAFSSASSTSPAGEKPRRAQARGSP